MVRWPPRWSRTCRRCGRCSRGWARWRSSTAARHVDLSATGSLAHAELAGALTADDMRLDVPQYGVHWREGRLRGRFANNTLILDDLSFTGGDGRFTAQGTLARAQREGSTDIAPEARVTWTAEKFRAVNRPDLQFTVGGNGVLAFENGKIAVRGNLEIAQGRVQYEPVSVGQLVERCRHCRAAARRGERDVGARRSAAARPRRRPGRRPALRRRGSRHAPRGSAAPGHRRQWRADGTRHDQRSQRDLFRLRAAPGHRPRPAHLRRTGRQSRPST